LDLSRTRVVLRERALLDVFDLALRFIAEHGAGYARTAALVLPPFVVASILLGRAWGATAAWCFAIGVSTFAAAPFTLLASRLVFEDDVRATAVIGAALRSGWTIVRLRAVVLAGALVGGSVLLVPGVWSATVTTFVIEVATLERSTVRGALARSAALVRRATGEAAMGLLLLCFLHAAAALSAESGGRAIIGVLLESRAPASVWTEGWSWLTLAGFWAFVPYAATVRLFVYLDIRTRSEGWDIQTRFVALAARPTADARSAA
jgi:hypothetical protein